MAARWALVYNSVGSVVAATAVFWGIPYADRLKVKGTPWPQANFYGGPLYRHGTEYRDEIEDLQGTKVEVMRATAAGIQESTMQLISPVHIGGSFDIFNSQFASGWSSLDFDGDAYGPHALGIVHRDIKPANLFVTSIDGAPFVKVLDFGIAKQTQGLDLGTTSTTSLFGTPYYMSPEQLLSAKRVDFRSDLWSLGVVAYQAMTGRTPSSASRRSRRSWYIAGCVWQGRMPRRLRRGPH